MPHPPTTTSLPLTTPTPDAPRGSGSGACVSGIGSGRGGGVDQWGPLVTRAPAVSAGTSRLMWGSKTVGSGEWYLTVQSADPLRTVEYHSPLPTPLRCQVPLSTPHAAASLPLFQRRRDDPRLLGGVRRGVPLSGTRALGPADVAHRVAARRTSPPGSSSPGWKRPVVSPSSRDAACGRRNRLLGVNRTRGRSSAWRPWRRSRWKYCAGVVQFAMRRLPSAPSARKRSMRALECSGP